MPLAFAAVLCSHDDVDVRIDAAAIKAEVTRDPSAVARLERRWMARIARRCGDSFGIRDAQG